MERLVLKLRTLILFAFLVTFNSIKKLSVKLQIIIWYIFSMIFISGIVLIAMNSFSEKMIEKDIGDRLIGTVSSKALMLTSKRINLHDNINLGEIGENPSFNKLKNILSSINFNYYEDGVYMAIYDTNTNLIVGNMPFEINSNFAFKNNFLRQTEHDGNRYYEYDKEINIADSIYYLKGISLVSDKSLFSKSVVTNNVILSVTMIFVASIGGYLILSRAFNPVDKITEIAKEISESNDLSRRININSNNRNDEIYRLASIFDKMLDKLEYNFEKEKQFTSDASHELRTPVSVIMSECEFAEECANDIEDYKESISSIKNQALRMSKLISELLTISKMDKDTLQTNFEKIDLSELLSFVCDEQEEINGTNVSLIRNIPENIIINADRFLITRALINLISNAYQYIGDGNKIEVNLKIQGNHTIFFVKDNGIGISKDHLPRIWERFYQVDTSRTAKENNGAGLGLSMVKWIVHCHNAEIFVESNLEEGTKFTIKFPIYDL